jgi:hypothetical protein
MLSNLFIYGQLFVWEFIPHYSPEYILRLFPAAWRFDTLQSS